jgi:nicotinate-nucleotide pyrophosphorylase (carboxylating)
MTDSPAPLDPAIIAAAVASALDEDRAVFDVTTHTTVDPDQQGHGFFLFKQAGVLCGINVAREAFEQLSPELELDVFYEDGDEIEDGAEVAEITGPLAQMLSAERVALNFLQRLSGIATVSRQYVEEAAAGGPARVVDTRKTTPGLRALERYAVRTGGAHNHRDNLQDGVLIKDNHLAAGAARGLSIAEVVALARDGAPHTLRIELEVDTPDQAAEAIAAGADIVLLDNMDPDTMRPIIESAPAGVLFEASGGVNLQTIRAIAATSVQLISVGALTHSAPSVDISLDIRSLDVRPV